MKLTTFIKRPILAIVISVSILILGIIGLLQLPLEQYPDIAPPTVRVWTNYTGANAETVQKSVIVPLEESLNGVQDMMYMTSSASNTGAASVSIYFRQGTDPDMAVVNVQNRIASATGLLPAEVTKAGVTVRKRQTSTIKSLSLYSPNNSYDQKFLTNYMKINIEPRLSRIAGVGEVNVFGASYSMRIWLDPNKMRAYQLVPQDVVNVLGEQNIEAPTGTLGSESQNAFQYVLKYRGRYEEEKDFGDMVIKSQPDGSVLRLRDVARIELGAQDYTRINTTNGHPSATCFISQSAGSNANEIITRIDAEVAEIQQSLPPDMVIADVMSTKDFLDASIYNVIETLLVAILLVVVVVYIFLQNLKATLIPTISIIVSLMGTFAFLYAVGFSLNLLTLFALVLVIGTVVDDAIVVVEAVQAKFDSGYTSPFKAANDAMSELTTALISTTFVFMAVFIPVSFLGGTTGVFYTQFGLTMAVAVAISMVNAMTLSPALSALMLRPASNEKQTFATRFHHAFNAGFNGLLGKYERGVRFFINRKWLAAATVVVAVAGLFVLMKTSSAGLVPQEDMGTVTVNVQCAPGSSLEQTERALDEVEECTTDIPQIKPSSRSAGMHARHEQTPSAGSFTIRLKPWSERKEEGGDQASVVKEIYRRTADIKRSQIRVSTRPMIQGYGSGSGFELHMQDRKGGTTDELLRITRIFIDSLNNRPEISKAYTTFATNYPQYRIEVDATKCKRQGVSPKDVLNTLSMYVGGSYASNLNRFTKLYRVVVQASPEFRLDKAALDNMYVRCDNGEMAQLSQFITMTRVYGSESLSRFNLFPSIAVFGENGEGYSSGEAIKAINEVAQEVLPEGYGYEFGGMTREEADLGNTTALVFVICVVFIYLILCALYESLLIPLAVILSVPFGLAGSFLFARIWGIENNIYMQTGLIMLIGLLAKTAILLTEYASDRRKAGMGIREAAIEAAKVRLRPILMTSFTMIVGLLPLVFAHGVGANGNISLGVGTVGGMLIGTLSLLFVVPVLFCVMQKIEEKFKHLKVEE